MLRKIRDGMSLNTSKDGFINAGTSLEQMLDYKLLELIV
jgi:hypothetical protein